MSVEVHIDWRGEMLPVGVLYPAQRNAAVTFEYLAEWLQRDDAFAIDPTSLPLRTGLHHASELFGVFQDCGPDRWGRLLIERSLRKRVSARAPRHDLDYVLALEDGSRIGALRFRDSKSGAYLSESMGKVPPIIQMGALIHASDAVHDETETAEDLRYLLDMGSPLGGARPKSAVRMADGRLAIAKFPKPDDTRDIASGEVLALTLAREAGIMVAEHQLVTVEGKGVSVIVRFDRSVKGRIPFLSAKSLLGLSKDDPGSYALIADGIRQFGDNVRGDLEEMWRRLIFSLLASNYDDHLRNHGFLMTEPGRWSLSPAYDLNPVPEIERSRTTKTPIGENQGDPSMSDALDVAARFGLGPSEAKKILGEVVNAVSQWKESGAKLGIKSSTLAAYESAFDHEMMREARRLFAKETAA
jgi:serine/threonine-protein kinase HipA